MRALPERRPRLLFVAEAVTLAHVARPIALALGLDAHRYEVALASDPRYQSLFPALPFPWHPLDSITSAQFLEALAKGRPVYDTKTLRRYVQDDLRLFEAVAPDLVVGDFRLSLAVSARLAGIPYLNIINAYWSLYARQPFPMPDLPFARWFGVPLAQVFFRLARPFAFALHAIPLNRVLSEHGLPRLGLDLRRVYTDADQTLYADVPELIPTFDRPENHHYLGPVLWSPAVPPPDWWSEIPTDRPLIYVTLGSSGKSDLLAVVLEALADLPVTVAAASAGRSQVSQVPGNARLAAYLPGEEAAARAQLVVCNGGSPTTQQALAAGRPVLGLASNLDQHLNMHYVQKQGAGLKLRAETAGPEAIRSAVSQILDRSSFAEAASRLAGIFAQYSATRRFEAIVAQVLGGSLEGSLNRVSTSTNEGGDLRAGRRA
jgi:UDP:flavonoid glycosyltransferase YjiC (YdhE family)